MEGRKEEVSQTRGNKAETYELTVTSLDDDSWNQF